jgi:hypothetical protein
MQPHVNMGGKLLYSGKACDFLYCQNIIVLGYVESDSARSFMGDAKCNGQAMIRLQLAFLSSPSFFFLSSSLFVCTLINLKLQGVVSFYFYVKFEIILLIATYFVFFPFLN